MADSHFVDLSEEDQVSALETFCRFLGSLYIISVLDVFQRQFDALSALDLLRCISWQKNIIHQEADADKSAAVYALG